MADKLVKNLNRELFFKKKVYVYAYEKNLFYLRSEIKPVSTVDHS